MSASTKSVRFCLDRADGPEIYCHRKVSEGHMYNSSFDSSMAPEKTFNLSEIVRAQVIVNGEQIGRIEDLLIVDKDKFAEVTHIVVSRPFGRPQIVVPWEKVKSFDEKEVVLDIGHVEGFVSSARASAVFLKDFVLDKKVLDSKDRELAVVYDVGLTLTNGKLLVVNVDIGRSGLLRRMKLGWLVKLSAKQASEENGDKVPWVYIEPLPEDIGSFKGDVKLKVIKEQLSELHPVDLADVLEEMGEEDRMAIFRELDTESASDTLEELDPKAQRDLIASLDKERAAQLINEMTPGQAADLLSVLPSWEAKVIIDLIEDKEKSAKIADILEKQDEKVIDFSITGYLSFPPDMTVEKAREQFAEAARKKAAITYIYVIDRDTKLLGIVDSKSLLLSEGKSQLKDIMTENVVTLSPSATLKRASELFARYLFRALPVTATDGKIIGILLYRDVVALRHRYVE